LPQPKTLTTIASRGTRTSAVHEGLVPHTLTPSHQRVRLPGGLQACLVAQFPPACPRACREPQCPGLQVRPSHPRPRPQLSGGPTAAGPGPPRCPWVVNDTLYLSVAGSCAALARCRRPPMIAPADSNAFALSLSRSSAGASARFKCLRRLGTGGNVLISEGRHCPGASRRGPRPLRGPPLR
jgi:hypothetical protein